MDSDDLEIKNYLEGKNKEDINQEISNLDDLIKKSTGELEFYYKRVRRMMISAVETLDELDPIIEENTEITQLCKKYAPKLRFTKKCQGYLKTLVGLHIKHIFKSLRLLAEKRKSKKVRAKDIYVLAEMCRYD